MCSFQNRATLLLPLLVITAALVACDPILVAKELIPLNINVGAVSDNGQFVVGTIATYHSRPPFKPAIWTPNGTVTDLHEWSDLATLNGISNDGQSVVGEQRVPYPTYLESFVWNPQSGLASIEGVSTLAGQSTAFDISANGQVIVGSKTDTNEWSTEAYRWTAETGSVLLGDLPGGQHLSYATATSADGSVIAGSSISTEGEQAFRWTQQVGMVGLGFLPGPNPHTEVYNISADGSTIVGYGVAENYRREAFRWTEQEGMQPLGVLPNFDHSVAHGVSGDGRVIVGRVDAFEDQCAFVWDSRHGMRDLQTLLEEEFDLTEELEGWQLIQALDISADGLVIVGQGFSPDGNGQGWMVRLDRPIFAPEPSSIALAFLATGILLLRRERRAFT